MIFLKYRMDGQMDMHHNIEPEGPMKAQILHTEKQ